jgi:hypothetical protein
VCPEKYLRILLRVLGRYSYVQMMLNKYAGIIIHVCYDLPNRPKCCRNLYFRQPRQNEQSIEYHQISVGLSSYFIVLLSNPRYFGTKTKIKWKMVKGVEGAEDRGGKKNSKGGEKKREEEEERGERCGRQSGREGGYNG